MAIAPAPARPSPPARPELRALTALRGVAALWVVAFHYKLEALLGWAPVAALRKGYLWVDFFFLLSGLVLAYVYGEQFRERASVTAARVGAFLRRRLARIYPVHALTLALAIASAAAAGTLPPWRIAAWHTLTNALLIQAWGIHTQRTWNAPAWSISTEWAAYLLFPVTVGVVLRARVAGAMAIGLACYGALLALGAAAGDGSLGVTYDRGLVRCHAEFTLGLLLYRAFAALQAEEPAAPARRARIARLLASDGASVAAFAAALTPLALGAADVLVIPGMAAIVLCVALNDARGGWAARALSIRPLVALGLWSYSLYMLHEVLRPWLLAAGTRWFGLGAVPPGAPAALYVAFALAACIALAAATYRGFEVPARAWISRDGPRAPRGS